MNDNIKVNEIKNDELVDLYLEVDKFIDKLSKDIENAKVEEEQK